MALAGVVFPTITGYFYANPLSSDAFCLFYDAKTKKVSALNGSGHSPEKLTIEYVRSRGHIGRIPLTDLNSVTVPGLSLLAVNKQ